MRRTEFQAALNESSEQICLRAWKILSDKLAQISFQVSRAHVRRIGYDNGVARKEALGLRDDSASPFDDVLGKQVAAVPHIFNEVSIKVARQILVGPNQ